MGKRHSKHKRARSPLYEGVLTAVPVDDVRRYTPVHTEAVQSLCLVKDDICLSGSSDKSLVLYKWKDGTIMQRWTGHKKEITKVSHAVDSDAFFSASRDTTVNMWKRGTTQGGVCQNISQTFEGHDLVVTGLAVSLLNNQIICTGSRDNFLRLWDVETGVCTKQSAISRNLVTDVKWVPDQHAVAQTSEDKCLRLWDTRSLQESQIFPRKNYIQTCCDVSKDSLYCVTSSNGFSEQGCEATLWDLRTGKILMEYKGHTQTTCACAFAKTERPLVVTCSNDSTVKVWDRDSSECLSTHYLDGAGSLLSLAVFPDTSICVGSVNTGVHVLSFGTESGKVSLKKTATY
ncbi:WD repeat-containing protein 31-like [Antedon mediterranea]|uniref:WD repeat-containing protein 31-like n=1 Tax=Antedon mediterranea TaxID=105859 RepID=UPI003AF6F5F6